jgi:hypothetical protein
LVSALFWFDIRNLPLVAERRGRGAVCRVPARDDLAWGTPAGFPDFLDPDENGRPMQHDEHIHNLSWRETLPGESAAWRGRPGLSARAWSALLCIALLPGCQELLTEGTSAGAGIAGASLAHAVGGGAAVTTGIGLGVQAAARAGLHYGERRAHQVQQDQIAEAAGPLPVGGVARWNVGESVPVLPDEGGEVTVSRVISSGELDCKEIVFSAGSGGDAERSFYNAAICRDGKTWRWASAEPATERWGALQ